MIDLDKGGRGFQGSRVWLGPSLGWTMEQVQPSATITLPGTYVVQPGDSLILVNVAGLVTIQLPDVRQWIQQPANQPATAFNRSLTVKDLGGNASSFNITIQPFSGQQIDGGVGSVAITTDKGSFTLVPLIDLTGWTLQVGFVGGGGGGGTGWPNTINVADFGATGNGGTDDTAALNAAFASLQGSAGTVLFPAGTYRITDTVVIGAMTGGVAAPFSFINVYCPAGPNNTSIRADAAFPNDGRPAVHMGNNKYCSVIGLNINNGGARGNKIGLRMGGPGGPPNLGNTVHEVVFINCSVNGWHIAVTDGNFGAASEVTYIAIEFGGNDTGWVVNDFNSLNHTFINLSGGGNTIGLDSGTIEGYHVVGGSFSQNQVDFSVSQNGICSVRNFRSEDNTLAFVASPSGGTALGGSITIENCVVSGDLKRPQVLGQFKLLTIRGSDIAGPIRLNTCPSALVMESNLIPPNPNTRFPFTFDAAGDNGAFLRATCNNNRDNSTFPPIPIDDFNGTITFSGFSGYPFFTNLVAPAIQRRMDYQPPGINAVEPFGLDTTVLSGVRALSEGPPPGGRSDVVLGTVATNAASVAGTSTLSFVSVPSYVVPLVIVQNNSSIPSMSGFRVTRVSGNTVFLDTNINPPGVANGDIIQFNAGIGIITPGKNLRVTGEFAAAATFNFFFKRTVTVSASGAIQPVATAGRFYPSDVGKKIKLNVASGGWTAIWGSVVEYIDSTHVNIITNNIPIPGGFVGLAMDIGEDEPDANYIVAGLCSDKNETFWITGVAANGFVMHSSNGGSTAILTALIVR